MKHNFIPVILLFTVLSTSCYSDDGLIHTSFILNENDLQLLIEDLRPELKEKITESPHRFLQLADKLFDMPEELFYLADKTHALNEKNAPEKVVSPSEYGISFTRAERTVSSLIIDPLKNLYDSAAEEGLNIVFASGYRSYEYQEGLYNRYVEKYGQEEADRFSARPGTSQHQLGTAVDFGTIDDSYALTPEGKWLDQYAGDFGFSLSYPEGYEHVTGYKWECWHYRYISVEGVQMQREFFSDIQQYFLEFWNENSNELKKVRRK